MKLDYFDCISISLIPVNIRGDRAGRQLKPRISLDFCDIAVVGPVSTLETPAAGVVRRLLKRLPAFSPVAVKLMGLVADENVSFKEVAKLIALDPALSGETLRIANSGLYNRRQPVQSVLHAIAIVGLERLTRLAVTAALWRGLPNRSSLFMKAWWRHNLATALVAEHSSTQPIDYAYTAGLLHGVGQLALFEHAGREYAELVTHAVLNGLSLEDTERASYGTDHAELAGLILEAWGLPEKVQDAAALHHWAPTGNLLTDEVQIGCAVAEHIGFGACGCHRLLAAENFSPALAELIHNQPLLDVVATEVNGIECSLL